METGRMVERAAEGFCKQFLRSPYLACTEQGLHALFCSDLLSMMPAGRSHPEWRGKKVCVVQPGYRSPDNLGRSKAQHWDIAVLRTPLEPLSPRKASYDLLRLSAIVEFGLNPAREHLEDDIDRLAHGSVSADRKFIIHLYRLSAAGKRFSGRDLTPKSSQVLKVREAQGYLDARKKDPGITIYYAMSDLTGTFGSQLWRLEWGLPPTGLI
jgi:hypothetical protein